MVRGALMAAILGSTGRWLSSQARRVASKKQHEQHLDADGAHPLGPFCLFL